MVTCIRLFEITVKMCLCYNNLKVIKEKVGNDKKKQSLFKKSLKIPRGKSEKNSQHNGQKKSTKGQTTIYKAYI
jgi:hypothetical protein